MNKTAIHAYAIDWNGVNYEINLRRIEVGDISFNNFDDAKAFILLIVADLIAHYKLSHAAWSTMSRQDWVTRTHKINSPT